MAWIAGALLALAGFVTLPVALRSSRLSRGTVRVLAVCGVLLGAAASVLGLIDHRTVPPWFAAPAAALAAVGLGAAVTLAVLSSTRIAAETLAGAPAQEPAASSDPGAELLRGGALIGVFERLAIVSTLLAGWPEGLAVVLAVKGLGRFAELKATKQGAAERFILGTLVSVLTAAACAGTARLISG